MQYPNISTCQQCGKRMVQLRETKMFCKPKCRQLNYRLRKGLPLTWKPDSTKKKPVDLSLARMEHTIVDYTTQLVQTKHGLRKILFNKVTNEVNVFAIKDGKEFLIK